MKQYRRLVFTAIAFGTLVVGTPSAAHATLMLELKAGADTVTLNDNDLNDKNSNLGVIKVNDTIGAFLFNLTVGFSKPFIGAEDKPVLDLFSVEVSGASGKLDIWLTDTDFAVPAHNFYAITETGGTTDGSVVVKSYFDNANRPFETSTPIADLGLFSEGAFSGSEGTYIYLTPGAPFSLTMAATVTHTQPQQITSFDAITKVPEPTTLALLSLGLVGVGLGYQRKMFNVNYFGRSATIILAGWRVGLVLFPPE